MEYTVVGLPYYLYNLHKKHIKVGTQLTLIHDKDNKHSKTAVQVQWGMYKIGYISGRESEELYKAMLWKVVSTTVIVTDIRQSCLKVVAASVSTTSMAYDSYEGYIDTSGVDDASRYAYASMNTCSEITNLKKEEQTMFEKIVATNSTMAQSAAFLEAGRIANNTAAKFVASKSPLMVKGYVDTAFGKLLIANAAAVAAEKFRPADKKLARLANAMITQAYQEVYQLVDIEKMLNEMLSSDSVKQALSKLDNSSDTE